MTGGAVFNIVPGEAAVISYPGIGRMPQRHAVIRLVTVNTKPPGLMTAATLGLFGSGLQSVRKLIVQIVNTAGQIVTPMTLQTVRLTNMTTGTPLAVERGPVAMLMSPIGGMNIGQGNLLSVAKTTSLIGHDTIVTGHAKTHLRHMSLGQLFAGGNVNVTVSTVYPFGDMLFMVKFNSPDRIDQFKRFVGIFMTSTAFVVILNIMTGSTLVHRRQILIGRPDTGFHLGVTVDTLDLLLKNVKLMGEIQLALRHDQAEIKATLRKRKGTGQDHCSQEKERLVSSCIRFHSSSPGRKALDYTNVEPVIA